MKIKKTYPSKKKLLLVSVIVAAILLVGALLYYFLIFRPNYDPTTSYQPEYPESVSNNPQQPSDNTDKQPTPNETGQPSEEVPVANSGSVTVTNLNQKDGYVNALATVTNFVVSQCVYSFSSEGSRPVVREQTGGCGGISVPQDEFDKIGDYTLTVSVYGSGEKLTATKEIYVQ